MAGAAFGIALLASLNVLGHGLTGETDQREGGGRRQRILESHIVSSSGTPFRAFVLNGRIALRTARI